MEKTCKDQSFKGLVFTRFFTKIGKFNIQNAIRTLLVSLFINFLLQ